MSKPGRNDPCYCGSGLKYKKCHMTADKEAEKERRQMVDAAKFLRLDFLKFARDERFAIPFATALPIYWMDYYNLQNAEEMSEPEAYRFIDWFVFDYQPEDLPRLIDVYFQERREDLSSHQQEVLDRWVEARPASAYELLDYDGQLLSVRDFITGEEVEIYESTGPGMAEPGDLLLGRLVPVVDRLEFFTYAAYLPQDEIGDLAQQLESARAADAAEHPDATTDAFLRRQGHLIIHHALKKAVEMGRPPVAAEDSNRSDHLARKAARQLRRLHGKL